MSLQIHKWMQMPDNSVFMHPGTAGEDKIGNATVAIKLEDAKTQNYVLNDGHGSTVSVRSILKIFGWPPTQKQFRMRWILNAERHIRTREKEK